MELFRPIALANFKFKIIIKVLADRLATVARKIISPNQHGFVQGRKISDCICTASEAINLLNKKSFGGNIALKIDIKKAFDTIDWNFLLKVLHTFGFEPKFTKWIAVILQSAKLSIAVNGNAAGFFSCSRGVRQGDPLSPLLFCLAEEVLSRGITSLVSRGELNLMAGPRGTHVPSHVLYTDDVMIFCKGTQQNLHSLMDLFRRYGEVSGQVINPNKSTFYSGGLSANRQAGIANALGFSVGKLPFTYLGVPLFQGKPRRVHLQPIADRIKSKLAGWKASLLSIMRRVQLVKSIIHSMLIYSFHVYAWPVSLVKQVDNWTRNFIWAGDINTKKIVTVAWHRICNPVKEGGLGIKSLRTVNKAAMLKLTWELIISPSQWASIIKARVLRGETPISYNIRSSIWSGLKNNFNTMMENHSWQLGSGTNINFWTSTRLSKPLVELLQIPRSMHSDLTSTVHDFISHGRWCIPSILLQNCSELEREINQISIPREELEDRRMWSSTASGDLSLRDAFHFVNPSGQVWPWGKLIWSTFIPLSKSFVTWRALHNRMPTDENLRLRGCITVSVCSLCGAAAESTLHLFCNCSFAQALWDWLGSILNQAIDTSSFASILSACNKTWSSQIQEVVTAAVVNIIWIIWYCRNKLRFENQCLPLQLAKNIVVSNVYLSGKLSNGTMSSSVNDLLVLKAFSLQGRPRRAPNILQVIWSPPQCNWVKCNTDGAAKGCPGPAGCGGVFRDQSAAIVGCIAANLGLNSALQAELIGAMLAIELAYERGWHNLWIESDSELVVAAFKNPDIVPWRLRNRWQNCLTLTNGMHFQVSHIYREGNSCADKLARHGVYIQGSIWWDSVPAFVREDFFQNRFGLPFYRFR